MVISNLYMIIYLGEGAANSACNHRHGEMFPLFEFCKVCYCVFNQYTISQEIIRFFAMEKIGDLPE